MNDTKSDYGLSAFYTLKKGNESDNNSSAANKNASKNLLGDSALQIDLPDEIVDCEAEENEKDKRHNRIKSLVKLLAFAAFIILIVIIGSIAWFTMNRENETNGVQMTATEMPFDIATKGTSIRNNSVSIDEWSEYTEGSSSSLSDMNNQVSTYYSSESLKLRFSPVDDPLTDDINEETNPPDIGPDSSGEISLFVVPKVNSSMNIRVSLDIVAFANVTKLDSNGDPVVLDDVTQTELIEIRNAGDFASRASAEGVNNVDVAEKASDYAKASDYLKGHLIFFSEEGNLSGVDNDLKYYFASPYTTRNSDSQITFEMTIAANNKGKAVRIPLYWMWTNTLGQIVLKNNNTGQINGISTVRNLTSGEIESIPNDPLTDKEKMINYVKDNKNYVLKDWNNIVLTPEEEASITSSMTSDPTKTYAQAKEDIIDGMIDDVSVLDNFTRLSKCYNSADNDIGKLIAYYMIEVTVDMVQ